jgi:hypothetical protein
MVFAPFTTPNSQIFDIGLMVSVTRADSGHDSRILQRELNARSIALATLEHPMGNVVPSEDNIVDIGIAQSSVKDGRR